MGVFGEAYFWVVVAFLMFAMAAYGLVRVLQRPSDTAVEDQVSYSPVLASSSHVALGVSQELYIETDLEDQAAEVEQDF